jgi:hypothetical protein
MIDIIDRFIMVDVSSIQQPIAEYICPYCKQEFENNGDLVEHLILCPARQNILYPKLKLPKLIKQKTLNDYNSSNQKKLI